MYKNIYCDYNDKLVHIWDDEEGHIVDSLKEYDYAYKIISEDEAKTRDFNVFQSIEGKWCKRVKNPTWKSREEGMLIEHDLPLTTKILLEKYPNNENPSTGHNIFNFDIETEIKGQFPDWKNPQNKITAISFHNSNTDEFVCLILDEDETLEESEGVYGGNKVKVYPFKTEYELLETFIAFYKYMKPDILIGWNCLMFDIPYLYNRTIVVCGEYLANMLSPISKVYYDEYKNRYIIGGVSCLDYMDLYKKFEINKSPSYRLDAIGKHEVGLGKINYRGTLDDLFREDINKFIEYNVNDVLIVKKLDEKLDYVNIAIGLCHQGHVPYEDVFQSSRYIEGAIINFCRNEGIVTKNKPVRDPDYEGVKGAYVREPIIGRYDYVYDLDLTSLYPSTIISLNSSPETKVGKLYNFNFQTWLHKTKLDGEITGVYKGDEFVTTYRDLKDLLEGSNCSLSANGILYTLDFIGFIPKILIKWFDERVEFKRLRDEAFERGDEVLANRYSLLQYLKKIQLNTVYGTLGLSTFRFFDPDNALATTSTGKAVILETSRFTDEYYSSITGVKDAYVKYLDTDSIFVSSLPIIDKRFPDADYNDVEDMVNKTTKISVEVKNKINSNYDSFVKKTFNVSKHRFHIKEELISRAVIWIAKKRYAQMIVSKEGRMLDEPLLDVKGIDVVRSNFPQSCRELMNTLLIKMLENKTKQHCDEIIDLYKSKMTGTDIVDIAKPTGVSNLDKYIINSPTQGLSKLSKGVPVFSRASIIYNDMIRLYKIDTTPPIKNGEKIKWTYLVKNPYGITNIAFRDVDEEPKIIMDILDNYVDFEKMFESNLEKKLNSLYKAMKWGKIVKSSLDTLNQYFTVIQ